MKGQILDFSIQNGGGLITAENGKRYSFKSEEWKEPNIPMRGMKVDFDIDENGQAIGIYKALAASSASHIPSVLNNVTQVRNDNGQLPLFALFLDTLLRRYAKFSGRASKREFWGFALFELVLIIAIIFLYGILYAINRNLAQTFDLLFTLVYIVGLFLPRLAVSIRRLHDTGRSGWWYLIILIPIIGPIWLIILWLQPSVNEENQWGTIPE